MYATRTMWKQFFGIYKIKHKNIYLKRYASTDYEYDLVVIGGGSGGLSCAKEASSLGKKIALLDYVKPTPKGNKWGLGGTCVNVGCIPKKLFHQGALLGESINDAKKYGWQISENVEHKWELLQTNVKQYIKSLNFGYRAQLKQKNIDHVNAKASFLDKHTIALEKDDKIIKEITAHNFVIAVGGRPNYPDIPGAREYGITSDDVFFLQKPPGKTLIVGASYIALECAGFLNGLGFDTTLMVRSIFLRGFDQEMANITGENMIKKGVHVLRRCIPLMIDEVENSKLKVTWESEDKSKNCGIFETVLFAIGRKSLSADLNLNSIGVKLDPVSGKVIAKNEQSSIPNIYAIGDCLKDAPELTPVASKAGKLLAQRIFKKSKLQMDYTNVATTVFTPIEYGCVGLSEEDAIKLHTEKEIEIYHEYYTPLENAITIDIPKDKIPEYYLKVICLLVEPQKVLGIHIIGPHAGEIIQGFAVAMKSGLTKRILEQTVGIHPTVAEEIVKVDITKRSGKDPHTTGC